MPLDAWSDAYPYRSPLHDPWTGLLLELTAMSEQPIADRQPSDEDQPVKSNVTYNAVTITSGGPGTAIRYGQVASWADYVAACQERDRLAAERERFLAALDEAIVGARSEVEAADDLTAALVPILRWAREDAQGAVADALQEERDQARAALAALRPLIRHLIEWAESDGPDQWSQAVDAGFALGEALRGLTREQVAWALEGE